MPTRTREVSAASIEESVNYSTEVGCGVITLGSYCPDLRRISDVSTPGYERLIASGAIVNNPCQRYSVRATSPSGTRSVRWTKQKEKYNDMQGHLLTYLAGADRFTLKRPAYPTDDLSWVKTSVLGKLDAAEEQLGEDVAEIKELIRLIRNPLSVLVPASAKHAMIVQEKLERRKKWRNRWFKHRKRKPSVSALRKARNRDLAWAHQQAWMISRNVVVPTFNSALATGRVIANWNNQHPGGRRSEHVGTTVESHLPYDVTLGGGYRTYSVYHNRLKLYQRASILYQVRPMVMPGLAEKTGLRLKDLPATAWNVCPYSYLINRLVDIQSVINAVVNMSDPSITILAGSLSLTTVWEYLWTMTERAPKDMTVHLNAGTNDTTQIWYDRSTWKPQYEDLWHPRISGVDKLTFAQLLDLCGQIIGNLRTAKSLQP